MSELSRAILLAIMAAACLYTYESAEPPRSWFVGLIGIVGVVLLIGALFWAVAWVVDLGTTLYDRLQSARSITPEWRLARELASLPPGHVEYLRQHGMMKVYARLDMGQVVYSFPCIDGHEIPYYDPDGNDLQTLLRDMVQYHPNFKPIREYGNNSIMQRHARSFAITASRNGAAHIWDANYPAKWREGWSAERLYNELFGET